MLKSLSITRNIFYRALTRTPAYYRGGVVGFSTNDSNELGDSDVIQVDVEGEARRESFISQLRGQLSAFSFADMEIILARVEETVLKHPMHPSNVTLTSRPPTKEEISRASEESLLDNPDLFQLSVPVDVNFRPYLHGGRDSEAFYEGKVKFSLFGLPGKC